MKTETKEQRVKRILSQLEKRYPSIKAYDLDGRGKHFYSEIDPVADHPEYDRVIEVIISSKPHKHLKMTQRCTILSGTLKLHVGKKTVILQPGDKYVIHPGNVHWATSENECRLEIYSEPGWTEEDHILV